MQIEDHRIETEQNYREEIKKEFTTFIQSFRDSNGDFKYEVAARNAINASKHHIVFSFKDLLHHSNELANVIFQEYYKY